MGGAVGGGGGVQVGRSVGVAEGGPGRATMIRLMIMLLARSALMTQNRIWLKLRFWRLRLRLLTKINLR